MFRADIISDVGCRDRDDFLEQVGDADDPRAEKLDGAERVHARPGPDGRKGAACFSAAPRAQQLERRRGDARNPVALQVLRVGQIGAAGDSDAEAVLDAAYAFDAEIGARVKFEV